jgi:hypothetical protein
VEDGASQFQNFHVCEFPQIPRTVLWDYHS